ncbi:hypothetical protein TetV_342 [Tetraselmis virus 1]|uniref:Uncharacterized protein n=1 Tax=Tetraselmis virus 1 TaxID=2060617 RepID=A0A2P0VNF4_9VIRU|nr:hypothetical protein QJ968_gp342 [Tetraselmis virus 1]AUF82434.1 hypothetical protein TetV_342 [Tetraselmis virus 1]
MWREIIEYFILSFEWTIFLTIIQLLFLIHIKQSEHVFIDVIGTIQISFLIFVFLIDRDVNLNRQNGIMILIKFFVLTFAYLCSYCHWALSIYNGLN